MPLVGDYSFVSAVQELKGAGVDNPYLLTEDEIRRRAQEILVSRFQREGKKGQEPEGNRGGLERG